ncbi:hypothetical protein BJX99DRAFT_225392 [Aspergillus californicus]
MGLSAPRKKTKISHDPNNTQWSRSTTGFGHKILSSQGWTPGSFLGARNAAHADMFTSASASHIRVIVKDDTLGLGARSKGDPLGEPTGLDAFKGLLGRLNGKSDTELQADQRKRDDVKLARYAATKWQAVRFVSAGLLNQEKVDDPQEDQGSSIEAQKLFQSEEETKGTKPGDSDDDQPEGLKSSKRQNKTNKKDKKEKKEKKGKKGGKRKRAEQQVSDNSFPPKQSSEGCPSKSKVKEPTLSVAKPSTIERRPLGRHMIRGRHIAQKKKALLDDKSLNEIFMIKS